MTTNAHFVSAWDSVPVDGRTTGNLIARLLMEEERVLSAKEEDSTPFAAARKFNPIKKCLNCGKTSHLWAQCFRLGLGKNSIRCHFCNKLGHIKKDCYQFKRETQKSESTNVNRDEAFTVSTSALIRDTYNDYTWFLDTGASEHLRYRKELFSLYHTLNTVRLVKFGDGRVLKADSTEQSGRIEREMCKIGEAARTMTAKGLEKKFWAEAVNTTVYVINRTGTSTVEGKTPYQLWEGKDYNIILLKVFGLEVYVHVADQTLKKWVVKSKEDIFVS
ncbi:hypothetical protein PR048_015990 [Dryococelus australis]|uniref:CCHC-type domain-containing protein n=1 Tax=Dryococelus australis TaxID=614101 RepID=A0ABQ9HIH6_9NEOP|nr:hypothetical protein PR048_015990 [Dryococelus australis]